MLVVRQSPLTGKVHAIELNITFEQIMRYAHGEPIQSAFPCLTPSEREYFHTGITNEEWSEIFSGEEKAEHDQL